MNKRQRIVLIVGAILLLLVVFTTPKYFEVGSKRYSVVPDINLYPQVDLEAGILRALGVIGATLLVTYALKDRKEDKS